jgi:hypothetical protein
MRGMTNKKPKTFCWLAALFWSHYLATLSAGFLDKNPPFVLSFSATFVLDHSILAGFNDCIRKKYIEYKAQLHIKAKWKKASNSVTNLIYKSLLQSGPAGS